MGYIIKVSTGEVIESGDIGNLAERLNAAHECGIDISDYRIIAEES